jgi:hypothetical protein
VALVQTKNVPAPRRYKLKMYPAPVRTNRGKNPLAKIKGRPALKVIFFNKLEFDFFLIIKTILENVFLPASAHCVPPGIHFDLLLLLLLLLLLGL